MEDVELLAVSKGCQLIRITVSPVSIVATSEGVFLLLKCAVSVFPFSG